MVTCTVAFAVGLLLDNIYKKRWDILWFKKTDELVNPNTNYAVIFLGNSRVHFAINPYYIDSVTKFNSFNFGNGGADAQDIMLTLNIYLQNHKAPELVIISLDPGIIMGNEILKTRYHYLFYLNNDSVYRYMNKAGFLTTLIKIFPFTKYSFFDEYNRTSLFVKGKPYPEFNHNIYKGFLNIHQTVNSKLPNPYNADTSFKKISDTAIMYLKSTLTLLQQKGSKVVFVWPPLRNTARNKKTDIIRSSDSIFSRMANEYHIKQFNFENDELYKDEYFVDAIHFNEPGSRIYSMHLADSINSLYKK